MAQGGSRLSYFHDSDASAAKLHMLVLATYHVWYGVEVLSYQRAQDTVALAVKYAYLTESHQYGIVNESLCLEKSLVTSQSPDVYLVMEGATVLVNNLSCRFA